jgi:glutaredoxin
MDKPKVIAYLKPTCGWSQGVRAVLRKYDLPFEDRDIINDPAQREEMTQKSGQPLSPCVEVNGHVLADVSGSEVEAFFWRRVWWSRTTARRMRQLTDPARMRPRERHRPSATIRLIV